MSDEYERGIKSVERVEIDDLNSVFVPHHGSIGDLLREQHLERLKDRLANGEWHGFEITYRTPPLDDVFQMHQWVGQQNESDRHKELKVLGAHFLEYCGHTIPREEPISLGDTACGWEYRAAFESRYAGGIADVQCACEICTTVVEVGKVSPKKFLGTPSDGFVGTFVVIPYNKSERGNEGIEQSIFVFHNHDHSLSFANPIRISELESARRLDPNGADVVALGHEPVGKLRNHVSDGGSVIFDVKTRLDFLDSRPKFIGPRGSVPQVVDCESVFAP